MSDDRFAYQEPTFAGAGDEVAIQQFITRTYGWMSAGLALTAVVAMFVASSQEIVEFVFGNRLVFYAIIGLEFALVWMLSASVTRLPEIAAIAGFLFYAVLNGITIAVVLYGLYSSIGGRGFCHYRPDVRRHELIRAYHQTGPDIDG